jgi:hypothetical protein
MSELSWKLYQLYAEPFDLPTMKLLILHVSEHRDESLVRPIWNRIFEDCETINFLMCGCSVLLVSSARQ